MGDNRSSASGIAVRSASKALGGRTILTDIDLELARGQVAVLAGANGSGKTTLIKILSTVVTPDSGEVRVAGYDVGQEADQVRKHVGVVFVNDRSLFWRLDGRTNLRLFGRLSGMRRSAAAVSADAALEALGLTRFAGSRVGALSTGQRQRLMLARALISRPSVLLLDEPLRGLDDEGLDWVRNVLLAERNLGTTVLVVAPIVTDLVGIADLHVRLVDGRLVSSAGPAFRS